MEKFFEVKGTKLEKLEKAFLEVGVIPGLIIAIPALFIPETEWKVAGIGLAGIYLIAFLFISQRMK